MAWFSLEKHDIDSALIDQLEIYWRGKANTDRLPARRDIEPADLVPVLPYLLLAEIERAPFRVRFRLVGTQVVTQSRRDFTGCYLDELSFHDNAMHFGDVYSTVAAHAAPVYGVSEMPCIGDGVMGFCFAVFPLAEDGRTVSHAVAIEDYRSVTELETGGRSDAHV